MLAVKDSKHCKKADFDRAFIATDVATKSLSTEQHSGVNRAKSLSTDEFMCCMVNVAVMRHLLDGQQADLASAVQVLYNEDILPKVVGRNGQILTDPNTFRIEELYNEGVDTVLRRYASRSVHAAHLRLRRPRTPAVLSMAVWCAVCATMACN